jgi:hypothetical protein
MLHDQTHAFVEKSQVIDFIVYSMSSAGIGPEETRVLMALARHTQGEPSCVLSRAKLASELGVTEDRYKALQARLVAAGLMVSVQVRRSANAPSVARRGLTDAGWAFVERLTEGVAPGRRVDTPAPMATASEVDTPALSPADIALLLGEVGDHAPVEAEAVPLIDERIAELGVVPADAEVVCRLLQDRVVPIVTSGEPPDRVASLVAQALWSILCGSTSYRGWSFAQRVGGVASLMRTGRWARPRSMPAGWEVLATQYLRVGQGSGVQSLH